MFALNVKINGQILGGIDGIGEDIEPLFQLKLPNQNINKY